MVHIILVIKGFLMGIALIIPGLSGGTLAMYLGIYEKLLHAIGNIFREMKASVTFLIPVFIGVVLSVVSLAKLLGYLIDMNSLIVLFFFIGLILGGVKDIYQKATEKTNTDKYSSVISFLVSFGLIIAMVILSKTNDQNGIAMIDITVLNIILLFFLGMAASMTMIVPGVSGSALLIVLGYYTAIVTNVAGEIFNFEQFTYNIQVIIPFGLGAVFGIILFSKVIEYLLKTYSKQTYFAILGFITASVIAIFFEMKDPSTGATHDLQQPIYENFFGYIGDHFLSFVIGIVLLVIGFLLSKKMIKSEL
jgi:putative membrane protein